MMPSLLTYSGNMSTEGSPSQAEEEERAVVSVPRKTSETLHDKKDDDDDDVDPDDEDRVVNNGRRVVGDEDDNDADDADDDNAIEAAEVADRDDDDDDDDNEDDDEEDSNLADIEDEGNTNRSIQTEEGETPVKGKRKRSHSATNRKGRTPSVAGLTIPFRTVKKAMKLDPDIPIVQNEAAIMTTVAAELFVKILAKDSFRSAKYRGRNTIRYEDIAEARTKKSKLSFLETLLP